MVSTRTLEQLDWPLILSALGAHCQTLEGRENAQTLMPNLDTRQVQNVWAEMGEILPVVELGAKPSFGELPRLGRILLALEKGQLLEGLDLRAILEVLQATKRVYGFALDFAAKSPWLQRFRSRLFPLPQLLVAIERAIAPDGSVLDSASAELASLRKQLVQLRSRLENEAQRLLSDPDMETYLQDRFFTVRKEKFVIPVRLDGRGRIKGRVIDTSDSGQTLFMEPDSLARMNDQLHDLEVAEKLEILRILRELSAISARELTSLTADYRELIAADLLFARTLYAVTLKAVPLPLVDTPIIQLHHARHPLLPNCEPNSIELQAEQTTLVVSGPNAGGKTVVLKTVGLLQLMARAGLFVPAAPSSKMYLFEQIFLELGDHQNMAQSLSSFSGHLLSIKPMLEKTRAGDLVLFDELGSGTEPDTGASLAQSILETFSKIGAKSIVTTHFDRLKVLAFEDKRFRNACLEIDLKTYQPTFRLILDLPGQSFGLELAQLLGFPALVIQRAAALKGKAQMGLDQAAQEVLALKSELAAATAAAEKEKIEAEGAKARWQEECKLLEKSRHDATKKVAQQLEEDLAEKKQELADTLAEMKKILRDVREGKNPDEAAAELQKLREQSKHLVEDSSSKLRPHLSDLTDIHEYPGHPAAWEELREGVRLFVIPLRKEGRVLRRPPTPSDPVEVQVGAIKIRVPIHDVRSLGPQLKHSLPATKAGKPAGRVLPQMPELVIQSPTNSLDVRGLDGDDAVQKSLNFIDRALLRGEAAVVIIHGNGKDRLKTMIREMLSSDCPYEVVFRPGIPNEGGDGVTIVGLKP